MKYLLVFCLLTGCSSSPFNMDNPFDGWHREQDRYLDWYRCVAGDNPHSC
jgi:hypothetical protein